MTRLVQKLFSPKLLNVCKTTHVSFSQRFRNLATLPSLKPLSSTTTQEANIKPEEISTRKTFSLDETDLPANVKFTLNKAGIKNLFEVQQQTLTKTRMGKDVIVRAKTGSGKTLAFILPIMLKFAEIKSTSRVPGTPTALVLSPTRELAQQIKDQFNTLSQRSITTVAVFGGSSVRDQLSAIMDRNTPVDVIVATPGRLKDLIENHGINLSKVKTLVLDEADEMLKFGFKDELEFISSQIAEKGTRHNMMFSATWDSNIEQVAKRFLNDFDVINLVSESENRIPDQIVVQKMVCPAPQRLNALSKILNKYSLQESKKCLVFANTKQECQEVASSTELTKLGLKIEVLNGDIEQRRREEIVRNFAQGSVAVVVATDVAARGLDLKDIGLVVHLGMSSSFESFVHRTGRTGRAGKSGTSILLYSWEDSNEVKNLEIFLKKKLVLTPIPEPQDDLGFINLELDRIVTKFAKSEFKGNKLVDVLETKLIDSSIFDDRLKNLGAEEKSLVHKLVAETLLFQSGLFSEKNKYSKLCGSTDFTTVLFRTRYAKDILVANLSLGSLPIAETSGGYLVDIPNSQVNKILKTRIPGVTVSSIGDNVPQFTPLLSFQASSRGLRSRYVMHRAQNSRSSDGAFRRQSRKTF